MKLVRVLADGVGDILLKVFIHYYWVAGKRKRVKWEVLYCWQLKLFSLILVEIVLYSLLVPVLSCVAEDAIKNSMFASTTQMK